MPKITPFLWFDTQAEEAMSLYASIFKDSKILSINRAQGRVDLRPVRARRPAVHGAQCRAHVQVLGGRLLLRGLRNPGGNRRPLGEADRRWRRARPVRLVEGQIRVVLANRSDSHDPDARGQRRGQVRARRERHDANGQAGSSAPAASLRRAIRQHRRPPEPIQKYYSRGRLLAAIVDSVYANAVASRRRTERIAWPPVHMASTTLGYGRKHQSGVNWVTTVALVIFHLGAPGRPLLSGISARSSPPLVLYVVAGMLGIGMGYHRLLTHRAYKTPKAVEYLLTWCATLALEGGPIFWVATHRIHHQHSDDDGNPHTPREGTWWAHMGWMVTGSGGCTIFASMHARYAPNIVREAVFTSRSPRGTGRRTLSSASRCWPSAASRTCSGGSSFAPPPACTATWLVNSATHKWGSRRFATRDDSTNNWWVALLTFGEGWHNNHHAYPTSARHGLAWFEVNLNWMGIRTLEALGLAWDIKTARIKHGSVERPRRPPRVVFVCGFACAAFFGGVRAGFDFARVVGTFAACVPNSCTLPRASQ